MAFNGEDGVWRQESDQCEEGIQASSRPPSSMSHGKQEAYALRCLGVSLPVPLLEIHMRSSEKP